jgi:bacteriorhodopsin
MTRDGDPGENGGPDAVIVCWSIAEHFNRTIKNGFYCCGFLFFPLVLAGITKAIHAYNNLRSYART